MYTLALVSRSWNGKRKIKVKGNFPDKREALMARDRLFDCAERFGGFHGDYRLLGPRQLKALQAEIKAEQQERRAAGAKKAAATRKRRGPAAFVLCPTCGSKSKLIRSEMGGLQTRVCQRGHRFEHDKWIADRAFWNPVAAIPNIDRRIS